MALHMGFSRGLFHPYRCSPYSYLKPVTGTGMDGWCRPRIALDTTKPCITAPAHGFCFIWKISWSVGENSHGVVVVSSSFNMIERSPGGLFGLWAGGYWVSSCRCTLYQTVNFRKKNPCWGCHKITLPGYRSHYIYNPQLIMKLPMDSTWIIPSWFPSVRWSSPPEKPLPAPPKQAIEFGQW